MLTEVYAKGGVGHGKAGAGTMSVAGKAGGGGAKGKGGGGGGKGCSLAPNFIVWRQVLLPTWRLGCRREIVSLSCLLC